MVLAGAMAIAGPAGARAAMCTALTGGTLEQARAAVAPHHQAGHPPPFPPEAAGKRPWERWRKLCRRRGRADVLHAAGLATPLRCAARW